MTANRSVPRERPRDDLACRHVGTDLLHPSVGRPGDATYSLASLGGLAPASCGASGQNAAKMS